MERVRERQQTSQSEKVRRTHIRGKWEKDRRDQAAVGMVEVKEAVGNKKAANGRGMKDGV